MEEDNEKKVEETDVVEDKPVSEDVHDSPKPKKEIQHSSEPKENLTNKMRENPWILSTLVLGILTLVLVVGNFSGSMTGNVVSSDVAEENLMNYLDTVADSEITLIGSEDEGNMYIVTVEYQGDEMPIYVTKDGGSYTPSLIPLVAPSAPNGSDVASQDVVKSDRPLVELFIMTHCPYGTQAEKGFIPIIKAMGDEIDAKIRFVHYFMHEPEETETPRQVCIREEQSDKFLDYLECFLEDGDSNRCLLEVGIDEDAMDECIENGNADDYYAEDSELSNSYGVGGSPTLVVNGVKVTSGRDSASYLDVVCGAFNDMPEECTTLELSTTSPSPGFGYEGTGSATDAQC